MSYKQAIATCAVCCLLGVSQAWASSVTPAWKGGQFVASSAGGFPIFSHDGADRALAYDHHGQPGIAFRDDVSGALRYARDVAGVGLLVGLAAACR